MVAQGRTRRARRLGGGTQPGTSLFSAKKFPATSGGDDEQESLLYLGMRAPTPTPSQTNMSTSFHNQYHHRLNKSRNRRQEIHHLHPIETDEESQASTLSTATKKPTIAQRLSCCKRTEQILEFPHHQTARFNPRDATSSPYSPPMYYYKISGSQGRPLNTRPRESPIPIAFDTASVVPPLAKKQSHDSNDPRHSLVKMSHRVQLFSPRVSRKDGQEAPNVETPVIPWTATASLHATSMPKMDIIKAVPPSYRTDQGTEQPEPDKPRGNSPAATATTTTITAPSPDSMGSDNDDDGSLEMMIQRMASELSSGPTPGTPVFTLYPTDSRQTEEEVAAPGTTSTKSNEKGKASLVDRVNIMKSPSHPVFRTFWNDDNGPPSRSSKKQSLNRYQNIRRNRGGLNDVASLDASYTTTTHSSSTADFRVTVVASLFDQLSNPSSSHDAPEDEKDGPRSKSDQSNKHSSGPTSNQSSGEASPTSGVTSRYDDDDSLFDHLSTEGMVERIEPKSWVGPNDLIWKQSTFHIHLPDEMAEGVSKITDDVWSTSSSGNSEDKEVKENSLVAGKLPVENESWPRYRKGHERNKPAKQPQQATVWANLGGVCEESSLTKQPEYQVEFWSSSLEEECDDSSLVKQPTSGETFAIDWEAGWSLSSGGSYDSSLIDGGGGGGGCEFPANLPIRCGLLTNQDTSNQNEDRGPFSIHDFPTAMGWLGTDDMVKEMFNCGET